MKIIFSILLLAISFASVAGDNPYATYLISPELLKKANVVKRMEEVRYELGSDHEMVYSRKYALTILNEAGAKHADFSAGYDKMRKIRSVEGYLYDKFGKEIKKAKNKDFQDQSAVSEISLIDDSRVKFHDFRYQDYPYTVEYEVEYAINNSYFFPRWIPQSNEFISVENSLLEVSVPESYDLRYRQFNFNGSPALKTEKGKKTYSWKITNIPAIEREWASPQWNELTTSVFLAPSDFVMEGYKGNCSSWQEFGKFALELNKGRDVLPDHILNKVKELTSGVSDEKEKVRRLYQFLQQNTRYISIQLGIGGLQPFEAGFVAQKGYGDCKALSNYMFSLLKAAGIRSHYTLVNSGYDSDDRYLLEDFPSDPFDHIILCVPQQKDTIWLECTSQTTPAGYMGRFTGNRKVLLITEEGGKLVSTPRYSLNDNLQTRTIRGILDPEGNLTATVKTAYSGIQQDQLHGIIHQLSKEKVKEYLQESMDLPNYQVNNFKYVQQMNRQPEIIEDLELFVDHYATITGKRLFIVPNMMNAAGTRLTTEKERKYDVCVDVEYKDIDTVEFDIPEGYEPEALPQPMQIRNKFGAYSSQVKLNGTKVRYIRIREQFAGRFSPQDYPELVKFHADIYKADRNRIVLVKK